MRVCVRLHLLVFVTRPRFANVTELTNDMFLNEIDKENKNVTIVVHIYDHVSVDPILHSQISISLSRLYLLLLLI